MPIAWIASGVAASVAVVSALADRGRQRRADPDRVGWVDWRTVQMAALGAAMICAGVAFRA